MKRFLSALLCLTALSANGSLINSTTVTVDPHTAASEIEAIVDEFFSSMSPSDFVQIVQFDALGNVASGSDAGINLTGAGLSVTADIDWDMAGTGLEIWGILVKGGTESTLFEVESAARILSGAADTLYGPGGRGMRHISVIGRTSSIRNVPDSAASLAAAGTLLALVAISGTHLRRRRRMLS